MNEQLAAYDAKWPIIFEQEARRLASLLGDLALRVDHVGSTAVPGLAAKPIIDIQVIVRDSVDVERVWTLLLSTDYCESSAPIVFFHRPEQWPHTHHVHIRRDGSFKERRLRLFRDWLRSHAEDRDAYAALKGELARDTDLSQVPNRVRYSEGKTEFVREIERRAGV